MGNTENREERTVLFFKNLFIYTVLSAGFYVVAGFGEEFGLNMGFMQFFLFTLGLLFVGGTVHRMMYGLFHTVFGREIGTAEVAGMFILFITPISAILCAGLYAFTLHEGMFVYSLFIVLMATWIRQMNLHFVVTAYREAMTIREQDIEKI